MVLESKTAPMTALYVGGILAGLLLMWLARDFTLARSNTLAGFLLGVMIFGLSAAAMVVGESRRVELDEPGRRIILEVRRRWGGPRRVVLPFAEIRDITIGRLGSRTDGSVYHDLVVHRTLGKEVYLFGGCVFEGRMSREWIEDLRAAFVRAL